MAKEAVHGPVTLGVKIVAQIRIGLNLYKTPDLHKL